MAWKPSEDLNASNHVSAFWVAIESVYNSVATNDPLPRGALDVLKRDYVRERRGDDRRKQRAAEARVPSGYSALEMGLSDLVVLDFVLNQRSNRIMHIRGPRGCGKTSLLRFVEACVQEVEASPPVFLFVEGAVLDGVDDLEEVLRKLLIRELKSARIQRSGSTAEALRAAERVLHKGSLRSVLRRAFGYRHDDRLWQSIDVLGEKLADPMSALLVIDNLDHLSRDAIDLVLRFVSRVHRLTGIGAIVATREPTYAGILERGTFEVEHNFDRPLTAPTARAWVHSVRRRVVREAHRRNVTFPVQLRTSERVLAPEDVNLAFDRYVGLLDRASSSGRSGLDMLEGMAGDDIRLLGRLIPRSLRHISLPVEYLVSATNEAESYFVVSAAAEDDRHFYRRNRDVPNLLMIDSASAHSGFLLSYRVLSMLALRDTGTRWGDLLGRLSAIGYADDAIERCVQVMNACGLVTSPMAETWDRRFPPEHIQLTRAGRWYVRRLLRDPDYLATVIVDVTLEHSEFSRQTHRRGLRYVSNFANRLDSLLEYAREVAERERRQVDLVEQIQRPSERADVAAALFRGGCFSLLLSEALAEIEARSRRGQSEQVRQLLPRVKVSVEALRKHVDEIQRDLQALGKAIVPGRHALTQEVSVMRDGVEIRVKPHDDADFAEIVAKTREAYDFGIFHASDARGAQVAAHVLMPPDDPGSKRLLLKTNVFVGARFWERIDPGSVRFTGVSSREAINIMAVELLGGRDNESVRVLIGSGIGWDQLNPVKPISAKEASELVGRHRRDIYTEMVRDGASKASVELAVRTAGVALARSLLRPDAKRQLVGRLGPISAVVVAPKLEWFPIEWLGESSGRQEETSLLGQRKPVVRAPLPAEMCRLQIPVGTGRAERFKAYGRGFSEPASLDQFLRLVDGVSVVHVVGHSAEDGLDLGGFVLTEDMLLATRLPVSVRGMVISACSAGANGEWDDVPSTIGQAVCKMSGCPVLCSAIRLSDRWASIFDAEFEEEFGKRGFVDGVFELRRRFTRHCLYSLYSGLEQEKRGEDDD